MNKAIGLITTNYANENFGKLAESRPVATVPFGGRYRLVDFPLSNMVHSGIRCVGITTAFLPFPHRSSGFWKRMVFGPKKRRPIPASRFDLRNEAV